MFKLLLILFVIQTQFVVTPIIQGKWYIIRTLKVEKGVIWRGFQGPFNSFVECTEALKSKKKDAIDELTDMSCSDNPTAIGNDL